MSSWNEKSGVKRLVSFAQAAFESRPGSRTGGASVRSDSERDEDASFSGRFYQRVSVARGYALSLAATALAAGIHHLLWAGTGHGVGAASMFIPVIVASALSAGAGPAVLALSASVFCLTLSLPTEGTTVVTEQKDIVGLLVFTAVGLLIIWLCESLARSKKSARSARLQSLEAEHRLKAVLDNAPVIVALKDMDGRYTFVNREFEDAVGHAASDVIGKCASDLFPPEYAKVRMGNDAKVLASRRVMHVEETVPARGGHLTTLSVKFPLIGPSGELEGVALFATDISDRKQAEDSLRLSEGRYERAASAGRVGVWELNLATHELYLAPNLKQMLGYSDVELPNHLDPWCKLVHVDDRDRVIKATEDYLEGRAERYEVEVRRLHRDGHYMWFLAQGTVIRDSQGAPTLMVGSDTDITDRKHAEEERASLLERERAARAEGERASRIKDEFLATLSHELRTPLNAILGWTHLLRRKADDPETVKQGLDTIERNSRLQAQIIEDLLDMSRIISGKIRLEIEELEISALVLSAVATVRPAAEAKGISIALELEDGLPKLQVDPGRLHQVLWNLLSNALKFTARGGTIAVGAERRSGGIRISVRDSGQGIRADFLPYVFDRFRQADASTTRRFGGLGLGLAIVKHLVELHGGAVYAESEGEGKGATFSLVLPLRAVVTQSLEPDIRRRELASGSAASLSNERALAGLHVLVVDDEPDVRALVARLLEESGALVTVAASAAEAYAAIERGRFDLMVSDIGMPEEDGYSFMSRVRLRSPDEGGRLPAVALTAYARPEDRERALNCGYDAHLTKPVEPVDLVGVLVRLAATAPRRAPEPVA